MVYDFSEELDIFEYVRSYAYHLKPKKDTKVKDQVYAAFYFRQDETTRNYVRRTYDILDYLGDLGGIFELVWLVFSLSIGFLIARQFNAKLVSDLYKVQEYSVD